MIIKKESTRYIAEGVIRDGKQDSNIYLPKRSYGLVVRARRPRFVPSYYLMTFLSFQIVKWTHPEITKSLYYASWGEIRLT